MKKKRNMIEVVIRVMLFLILTAAHAYSLAALLVLFIWSELAVSPIVALNYIIKPAICLVCSVSVFVTWCWFCFLILYPIER